MEEEHLFNFVVNSLSGSHRQSGLFIVKFLVKTADMVG
jgi:hypothetical protein